MRDLKPLADCSEEAASRPPIAYSVAMLLIGACTVGVAVARETHAGFNVKVRLLGSGQAASVPKSLASNATRSGTSSLNELIFAVTTPAGYFVRFKIIDPAVSLVEINGLGPKIRIVSGAKDVFVPSNQEGRMVSYSVKVRPGEALSVAPPVRATILP